ATYYNLTVTKGGFTGTAAGAMTVAGALTVNSGTFAAGANPVSVTGATAVAASATLTVGTAGAGGTLTAGGAFGAASGANVQLINASTLALGAEVTGLGTFSAATGSTVRYTSTALPQNVQGVAYHHLEIDKGATVGTLAGNATAGGNLLIAGGTLGIGSYTLGVTGTATVSAGTTLSIGTGTCTVAGQFDASGAGALVDFTGAGFLKLAGNVVGFAGLTNTLGTVEYNSTGADQTVVAVTYCNLTINKSGWTGNAAGSFNLNGNLSISAGTFAVGANTINIAGNVSVGTGAILRIATAGAPGTVDAAGTFNANGGSVTFLAGGGLLELSGPVTSLGTFTHGGASTVRYNNTAAGQTVAPVGYYALDIACTGQTATLSGTATVANTLTVNPGTLQMAAGSDLTVAGAVSVGGGGSAAGISMTGNCVLRLAASIAFNGNGTFSTALSAGLKPTVTWTGATRYGFDVNSGATANIAGLEFRYSDGDGLKVQSGATITDIDGIAFSNGTTSTPTPDGLGYTSFLNVRIAAGTFGFADCSFDNTMNCSVATAAGFGGVIEMLNATGTTLENDQETGIQAGDQAGTIRWVLAKVWVGGGAPTADAWNQDNNWSDGLIPTSADIVRIPVGNANCRIDVATAACKGIEITTGTLVMNAANTLQVWGDFKCNLTGTVNLTAGTISFQGGLAQKITQTGTGDFRN
ncbi:MAG: hypothetical protein RDV41_04855, partial [Planctomycetota bacterium]|nr:hypothetical protein [Planctomycetota bacterium]